MFTNAYILTRTHRRTHTYIHTYIHQPYIVFDSSTLACGKRDDMIRRAISLELTERKSDVKDARSSVDTAITIRLYSIL